MIATTTTIDNNSRKNNSISNSNINSNNFHKGSNGDGKNDYSNNNNNSMKSKITEDTMTTIQIHQDMTTTSSITYMAKQAQSDIHSQSQQQTNGIN
jgi:hypothetical protein